MAAIVLSVGFPPFSIFERLPLPTPDLRATSLKETPREFRFLRMSLPNVFPSTVRYEELRFWIRKLFRLRLCTTNNVSRLGLLW